MQAAWAQIGDVLEANKRIRAAQVAREVTYALHSGQLQTLNQVAPAQVLAMTAPVHSRVVTDAAIPLTGAAAAAAAPQATAAAPVSVAAQFARSRIAGAPVSPAMRRQTRPGSRLMRALPPLPDGGGTGLTEDGGPPPPTSTSPGARSATR